MTKTEQMLEDLTELTTTLHALTGLTKDVHDATCPLLEKDEMQEIIRNKTQCKQLREILAMLIPDAMEIRTALDCFGPKFVVIDILCEVVEKNDKT